MVRNLLLGAPVLFASCVSEPLTLEDAERIPPFVAAEHSDPAPWAFIRRQQGSADLQLKLAFRSEDLGDDVLALVYVDVIPGEAANPVLTLTAEASTFDQERSFEIAIPEAAFVVEGTQYSKGCHAVSVALIHASNRDEGGAILNKGLATRVTWWLEITAEPGEVYVADCPHLGVDALRDD